MGLSLEESRLSGSWLYKLGSGAITIQKWWDVFVSCRPKKIWFSWPGFSLICPAHFVGKPASSETHVVFSFGAWIWKCISIMNIVCVQVVLNFDYFITATDLQRESWSRRALNKGCQGIPIYSIPVGPSKKKWQNHKSRPRFSVSGFPLDQKTHRFGYSSSGPKLIKTPALQLILWEGWRSGQLAPPFRACSTDYIHLHDHADLQQIIAMPESLPHHFSVGDWFDFDGGGWSRFGLAGLCSLR